MGDLTPSTFPTAGSRPSPTTPTTSLATLLRSPTPVRPSTPLPLLVATLPLPPSLLPTLLSTMPPLLPTLSTPPPLSTLPLSSPTPLTEPSLDKSRRNLRLLKYLNPYLFGPLQLK